MDYLDTVPDRAALRQFLASHGWQKRVADEARFGQIIDGADRLVVVEDQGELVGFGRALCDGVSNGYLSMLCVVESHRGRGIGRAIAERLIGDDPQITWVLRAGRPGARAFWEALGFSASTDAMERRRR